VINGVWVSERKWRDPKEKLRPRQKKMWVEVESEMESDGSGDGWRMQGFHDIAFGLLGLQRNLAERNWLLREQNGFLQRIAMCMERTGFVEGLELDLDSTMREWIE